MPHLLRTDADSPAFDVAHRATTEAAYDDQAALATFARGVDVVTYEFENVPVEAARVLGARRPVRPAPLALEVAQDRLTRRTSCSRLGIARAGFRRRSMPRRLRRRRLPIGAPGILKTRRLGYDGKGQAMSRRRRSGPRRSPAIGGVPAIVWRPSFRSRARSR